jgi:hypothetical protein
VVLLKVEIAEFCLDGPMAGVRSLGVGAWLTVPLVLLIDGKTTHRKRVLATSCTVRSLNTAFNRNVLNSVLY